MNYESWQAQQKNAKDEERRKKSQAAEALRSYKGDAANGEASKLAQLKEQDRLRKLEAEKHLRGYRGTLSEEDAKLMAYKEEEKRKKQEAAAMLRGYQGTLSEDEAKLAATRDDERKKKQQAQETLYQNWESTRTEESNGTEPPILAGSVSAMKDVFNAPTPILADTGIMSKDGTAGVSLVTENIGSTDPPKMTAKFIFGVIGVGEYSSLDGYLEMIDQYMAKTIGEEAKKSMQFEYPSVANIKIDSNFTPPVGRIDVARKLVTIAITFVPPDREIGHEMKLRIVEAARTMILNGEFKKPL